MHSRPALEAPTGPFASRRAGTPSSRPSALARRTLKSGEELTIPAFPLPLAFAIVVKSRSGTPQSVLDLLGVSVTCVVTATKSPERVGSRMVETLREWERSLDARVQGLGARVGADGDALRALEEADPTEAARFGLRLMLVEEMRTLGSSDFALGDRKRAAHGTILRGLRGLSLGELADALVSGALWVSWTVAWEHHRFAFLSEHPALATPESRLQVVRAVVAASG